MDAVPVLPSSPGAVQVNVRLVLVGLPVARLLTAAGGVVSAGMLVVPDGELEMARPVGHLVGRLETEVVGRVAVQAADDEALGGAGNVGRRFAGGLGGAGPVAWVTAPPVR